MKKKNIKYLYIFLFVLLVFVNSKAQKTGINLTAGASPNTTLDVNGSVAYRGGIAITLANGANNDITLSDFSLFRITGPTAAFSVTGFTGGVNGRILTIVNATTQTMTITHQATSSANNQIQTTGSNITLGADGVAFFIYNSSSNKWVLSGGLGFSNLAWNVGGNYNTTSGTHFVGTKDAQDLVFKTSDTEGMRLTTNRKLSVGGTSGEWDAKIQTEGGGIIIGKTPTGSPIVGLLSAYPDSSYKFKIRGDNGTNTDDMYLYTYYSAYDASTLRLNVGDNGMDSGNEDAFQVGSFSWGDEAWHRWVTITSKGIGVGNNISLPTTKLDIDGAVSMRPSSTVNLTADNQAVTVGDRSFLVVSSDNATASNRTFTLSSGTQSGQILVILLSANSAELADTGNCQLSSTYAMGANDTITLIWNGSTWYETARSNN